MRPLQELCAGAGAGYSPEVLRNFQGAAARFGVSQVLVKLMDWVNLVNLEKQASLQHTFS